MSYILDALRRAEAQRSRGTVPTLHAPVLDALPITSGTAQSSRGSSRWLWGLIAASLIAGFAAWLWRDRADRGPESRLITPAVEAPVPVAVPQAALPLPVSPQLQPVPLPVSPALPAPGSVPIAVAPPLGPPNGLASPAAAPPPPVPGQAVPLSPGLPGLTAQPAFPGRLKEAPRLPAAPRDATAAVPTATREPPLPQRRDLPPELQRELPVLTVSGTVYSSDRAQRIVIVNGELLHEGDRIGADLVLEEIRRKDAVLRYKGQRFSIGP